MASGSSPRFPIGSWYNIEVAQDQAHKITVQVDNRPLVTFSDTERPYGAGNVGLYTEDAHVHYGSLKVAEY